MQRKSCRVGSVTITTGHELHNWNTTVGRRRNSLSVSYPMDERYGGSLFGVKVAEERN
jgi:hypothetical protein